ncbi:pilus assembly protein [Pseudofrankia sp. DC12]|uniref:pilus assembly protein n=1 Tax=Pseudofrankia sp. DC12 TaxID=683315 RepID=UPI000696E2CF|nr:pilus assembly protein [Pseudofrankia sp. DC12]
MSHAAPRTPPGQDRGSYALEFAFALPVLLLALLVVAGATLDATASAQVGRAARQAARAASLATTPSDVTAIADATARGNLRAGLCHTTGVDTAISTTGELTVVTVVVRCQFDVLVASRTAQASGDAVLDHYRSDPTLTTP